MTSQLDHTHDPAARSWVASAQKSGNDFPLQNLPFAIARRAGSDEPWRGMAAISDEALDLAALMRTGVWPAGSPGAQALALAAQPTLNAFMAAGPTVWRTLRHALFELLHEQSGSANQNATRACLLPQAALEFTLPTRIGDYTDFYTSIHHARNVGRVFRPDNPLTANFQWLPIAYHGRASSVVTSGTPFKRPWGQSRAPGAPASTPPTVAPCARLDFELEMGFFVGPGNLLGTPVKLAEAEPHIFGMCLLNDWSARDHQFWEMDPLGPFLGKNFCTSISPWIVTMDALAPYRCAPPAREGQTAPDGGAPAEGPLPLPYLADAGNTEAGAIDVQLSVRIDNQAHRARGAAPSQITRTSFRHQYWTIAQMLAQHTVNGCNLQPGDLLGTGTISGPTPSEAGAMVELSRGGAQPITLTGTGEQRAFLHDGDSVILAGWCERPGAARIGFGECRGTVLPAPAG